MEKIESNKNTRQHVLSVLSKTSFDDMDRYWSALALHPTYHFLKEPEVGMTMVRAKAGGAGQEFNMGEVTVTRSVVKLETQEVGFGYTVGRSIKKSTLMAVIDACVQVDGWQSLILDQLVQPLEKQLQNKHKQHKEKVERTQVNFFTMVRGES